MDEKSNMQTIITGSLFEIAKQFMASHSTKEGKIEKDVLMGTVSGCVSVIAMCLHILKLGEDELNGILQGMINDIKNQYKMFDANQGEGRSI